MIFVLVLVLVLEAAGAADPAGTAGTAGGWRPIPTAMPHYSPGLPSPFLLPTATAYCYSPVPCPLSPVSCPLSRAPPRRAFHPVETIVMDKRGSLELHWLFFVTPGGVAML